MVLAPIVPACRHAAGTISWSSVLDLWRMASEDSDQLPSGLLAIHCLHDFGDVRESVVCAMRATSNHANALRELLEVTLLRRTHRMPLEERNDRVDQIRSTSNGVSKQVLPMVVVPAIRKHGSHAEEPHELVETLGASFALRNHKLVGDLIAGFVASGIARSGCRTKPMEKHPSPSTKPITQPI